jgi:nicotinate phosphoribosyltransferase
MLQAYWREGMFDEATFSLFVRRLPPHRNFLLACGLDSALRFLELLRFPPAALDMLDALSPFERPFLDWLGDFRFEGTVRAVPEGTPIFAHEPILEVTAPLPQAQFIETFLMNQVHFQTLIASKGARVVLAAAGRPIADFGLRRMHGADAGIKAARALRIAGVASTSNVLAGSIYGIPVTGTMAHSYIQAHDREEDAFHAFASLYPQTVLLVDTYDTLEGVRRVVALAEKMGDAFRVRGLRLDSGDLEMLARGAREILDAAGLTRVELFASGGLDEHRVAKLVASGAPIDGFGVGTSMGVSRDAPALDIIYKLVEFRGEGRLKLSPGKQILPGRKQIFREERDGEAVRDVLARAGESLPGRPLLQTVMSGGRRLDAGLVTIDDARTLAVREIERLPERIRALEPAEPPYPIGASAALGEYSEAIERQFGH